MWVQPLSGSERFQASDSLGVTHVSCFRGIKHVFSHGQERRCTTLGAFSAQSSSGVIMTCHSSWLELDAGDTSNPHRWTKHHSPIGRGSNAVDCPYLSYPTSACLELWTPLLRPSKSLLRRCWALTHFYYRDFVELKINPSATLL